MLVQTLENACLELSTHDQRLDPKKELCFFVPHDLHYVILAEVTISCILKSTAW